MDEQLIKEGNELIADFMGLTRYPNGLCDDPTKNSLCFGLHYHSSWDWLVPVIKKVIKKEEKSTDIELPLSQLDIEDSWKAVLKYIRKYKGIEESFVNDKQETEKIEQFLKSLYPPTDYFVDNVCVSYRHDFGLLDKEKQDYVRIECREWIRAISNNPIAFLKDKNK